MPIKMRLDDEGERAESSCRLGVGINDVDAPDPSGYAIIIIFRCLSTSVSLSMMFKPGRLAQVS